MIEAIARVDGVIEKVGFCVVALLNSGEAALRFDPVGHQSDHIDRERWGGVVKRFFFDVRAILKNGWKIFVSALGEVLAYDDDGGAGRSEIFLRACEDQAEFFDVERARGDVRGHIRYDG